MGLETTCEARYQRQQSAGKVKLEEDGIHFRGSFRLDIPIKEMVTVDAAAGELSITFRGEKASFTLGPQAEKWALKIRSPKSRAQKLGLSAGLRVAILGAPDEELLQELKEQGSVLVSRLREGQLDLIFYPVCHLDDLSKLADLRKALQPAGAIWIVAPKGSKLVRESDILNGARLQGLTDVKVVSYSATLTAHKMVIPVSARRNAVSAKPLADGN